MDFELVKFLAFNFVVFLQREIRLLSCNTTLCKEHKQPYQQSLPTSKSLFSHHSKHPDHPEKILGTIESSNASNTSRFNSKNFIHQDHYLNLIMMMKYLSHFQESSIHNFLRHQVTHHKSTTYNKKKHNSLYCASERFGPIRK